jgi:AbrB family looped-hinge helix DNA binding protein
MDTSSVTSKGQVTIPRSVRQRLGIGHGSRVEFSVVGDHIEMRVRDGSPEPSATGYGMLKSRKTAVPADFDPASLLRP